MSSEENTIVEQYTLLWDLESKREEHTQMNIYREEQQTLVDVDQTSSKDTSPTLLLSRYEHRGILGTGGMGQVLRVYDLKLNRSVALKIINSNLISYPIVLNLFLKEAQTTAILQHPGIVPVYDVGTLSDGRYYFTMQEIQGITLKEAIKILHRPRSPEDAQELRGDWSIQRLLLVFSRICEAIGYAHDCGVLHRDIKPDNVMLGAHGEALIVDWGIAKLLPQGVDNFGIDASLKPSQGSVMGTPIYMSPEQAKGESDDVLEPSDVFSLGAVLYEILTGKEPRSGNSKQILKKAQHPLCDLPDVKYIDDSLRSIYHMATHIAPENRYQNAQELYQAIQFWLDGSAKRHQAEQLVQEARQFHQHIERLTQEIQTLSVQLKEQKKQIARWDPLSVKQPLWDMEDQLEQLTLKARLLEVNLIEKLHTALNHCPDFPAAHQTLADFYYEKHRVAEGRNDRIQAPLMAQLMRLHDTGRYAQYLSGVSTLELNTFVPSTIEIFQYQENARRLSTTVIWSGTSPVRLELPIGSYVAHCSAEGYASIQLPFLIRREEQTELLDCKLPRAEDVGDEECYVPAGSCYVGSRDEPTHPRRRIALPSFCMQRHPVTNRQYIQFLNALVTAGNKEEAFLHVPRARGMGSELGEQIYGFAEADGCFFLQPDSEGDCWELDWPVILITAENAEAYAAWYSIQTGKSWRLPTCQQWEKAARGVDERTLPWGDYFEPTWASVRGSRKERALPTAIGAHPLDISPFGVQGMAGNVQDFCVEENNSEIIYTKGGAWAHHPEFIDMAIQRNFPKSTRLEVAGFRLARWMEDR